MTLQPPLFPGVPHLRMVGARLIEVGTAACECCGKDFIRGVGRPRRKPLCADCLAWGADPDRLRTLATLVVGELLDGRFKKKWNRERRESWDRWLVAFASRDVAQMERSAPYVARLVGPEVHRRAASRSKARHLKERALNAALACLNNYTRIAKRNHERAEMAGEQGPVGGHHPGAVGAGGPVDEVR